MSAGFAKPLEGKTILDFSVYLPGPYCTSLLTAYGARVIKIEPVKGDPARHFSPALFEELNRDKDSVALDLKSDEGRATAMALAEQADAVLESFRPGTMTRLGLGYEALCGKNSKLVYCSLSGFGQDGPYRDRAAHDMNCLAAAGYFSVPSQLDNTPSRPQVRLSDLAAGQVAAHAISMALWEAEKTSVGRYIDTSMYDVVSHWGAQMILSTPETSDPAEVPWVMADSDLFKTADGRYFALATLEDKYWKGFCNAVSDLEPRIENEVYATRKGRDAHKVQLNHLLSKLVAGLTLVEWKDRLKTADTCWSPVMEGQELFSDPHFQARGILGSLTGASAETAYSLYPVKMDGARATVRRQAPQLGAHTETHSNFFI